MGSLGVFQLGRSTAHNNDNPFNEKKKKHTMTMILRLLNKQVLSDTNQIKNLKLITSFTSQRHENRISSLGMRYDAIGEIPLILLLF